MSTTSNKVIQIPPMRFECAGPSLWRISATVAGKEVFFESSTPLQARPEVLVCPFLLPAMSQHADLEVAGPVSPQFLDNLSFVRRRAMDWWPQFSAGAIRAPQGPSMPSGPHSAMFYTGGVDSSYTLRQLHPQLRYAVFNEGFDIPLHDSARLLSVRNVLRTTTNTCGVELLVVRTNLREHPLFNAISWEITHIAALAAIAHALGQQFQTMYVAASNIPPPWGSAPDLDAAWSTETMNIVNFSAELTRLQRVAAIARWEPLRGRLRVCWQNKTPHLNCGSCEKCVRTQIQLHVSGAPDGLDSFPPEIPLRSAIRRMHSVTNHVAHYWSEAASMTDDAELRKEIDRVLRGRKPFRWKGGLRWLKRVAARSQRGSGS